VRGPEGVRRLGEVLHGGVTGMALPIDEVIAERSITAMSIAWPLGASPIRSPVWRPWKRSRTSTLSPNLGLLKQVGALPA
jgi:hypothetical protein